MRAALLGRSISQTKPAPHGTRYLQLCRKCGRYCRVLVQSGQVVCAAATLPTLTDPKIVSHPYRTDVILNIKWRKVLRPIWRGRPDLTGVARLCPPNEEHLTGMPRICWQTIFYLWKTAVVKQAAETARIPVSSRGHSSRVTGTSSVKQRRGFLRRVNDLRLTGVKNFGLVARP
jgi:hypothetical protein